MSTIQHQINTELQRYAQSHKYYMLMKEQQMLKHEEKIHYIETMLDRATNKHEVTMAALFKKKNSLSKN